MTVDVTTRSYDNYRTGCNTAETRLTSEYVQKNGIRILAELQLHDPRGTEGQVLIARGITWRGGPARDIIYICDMSNWVYAFDFDTYEKLGERQIGRPMTVTRKEDMWGINPFWGILGTPVIDRVSLTLFAVALITPDGTINTANYWFLSISLIDLSDRAPPLPLADVIYLPPDGGSRKRLGDSPRKQRAALTLVTRTDLDSRRFVYVPFGSFYESSSSNLGWVIAFEVTRPQPRIDAAWTTGSKYIGAGLWMAGGGLSVDADFDLYGMTGNGGFDPPHNVAESFIALQHTPGNGVMPGQIECVRWWSPFSDADADGTNATDPQIGVVAPELATPTNAMNDMMINMTSMAADGPRIPSNRNLSSDEDLGSGEPLHLAMGLTGFDKEIIIGAGKHSIAYTVDAKNMGNTTRLDHAPDRTAANYAKLLGPPVAIGYNGLGADLTPASITQVPLLPDGYTRHVHGSPVGYLSPDHGVLTFWGPENCPVKVFRVNPDYTMTYMACGQEVASAGMLPPGGMPGSMLTLSCDGEKTNTAVLWALMPLDDDANQRVVKGRLCAYAANWLDQNGHLMKIWDSQDFGMSWMHNKFNQATVDEKVLLPTYNGTVMIFG